MEKEIAALTALFKQQFAESAARERLLTDLFNSTVKTLTPVTSTPSSPAPNSTTAHVHKPVAVDRPILLSSSTLADFSSWEESWEDYSVCQHLHLHDRATRVSAVRQAFDKDIRRYLREGVIVVPPSPDVPEIIAEIKKYYRRQRNPLLDRLDFYNRRQQQGESFDSFMAALKELFSACDFSTLEVCSKCAPKLCQDCPNTLKKANEDILRDRIVVGVHDDDTRHKLLAHENLTLIDAVRICRSEENAKHAGHYIPQPAGSSAHASMNAVKPSTYQRQKQTHQPKSSTQTSSAMSRCPNCGRGPHVKSACPANGGNLMAAKVVGILRRYARRRRNHRLALTRRLVS